MVMSYTSNIHPPRQSSIDSAMMLEYLSSKATLGGRMTMIDYGIVTQIWGLIQAEQTQLNQDNVVNITVAAQTLRGIMARMDA